MLYVICYVILCCVLCVVCCVVLCCVVLCCVVLCCHSTSRNIMQHHATLRNVACVDVHDICHVCGCT